MAKIKYQITKDDVNSIRIYMNEHNLSAASQKRLIAMQLRGMGKSTAEICEGMDIERLVLSAWARKYCEFGIEALIDKRGGDKRSEAARKKPLPNSTIKMLKNQGTLIIDSSYNKFTIEEIIDLTEGHDKIVIFKDFNNLFDLIYELSCMGGQVSAFRQVLEITF